MDDGHFDMVLQVLSDTWQMVYQLHAFLLQVVSIANARDHQQPGRVDRTRCYNHLAIRMKLNPSAPERGLHTNRALPVEDNAQDTDAGLHGKVLPLSRGLEIARGRTSAAAVARVDLVEATAFLVARIEVGIEWQACLLARLYPDAAHRVGEFLVGNGEGAVGSMQLVGEAVVGLAPLEIGENVIPTPSVGSGGLPLIVVAGLPPQIDHGVDRAAAAQDACLDHCRFWIASMTWTGSPRVSCHQVPLARFIVGHWQVYPWAPVRRPFLKQKHRNVGIFAQAGGQYTARRSTTNNYEMRHVNFLAVRGRGRCLRHAPTRPFGTILLLTGLISGHLDPRSPPLRCVEPLEGTGRR